MFGMSNEGEVQQHRPGTLKKKVVVYSHLIIFFWSAKIFIVLYVWSKCIREFKNCFKNTYSYTSNIKQNFINILWDGIDFDMPYINSQLVAYNSNC